MTLRRYPPSEGDMAAFSVLTLMFVMPFVLLQVVIPNGYPLWTALIPMVLAGLLDHWADPYR